MEKVSGVFRYFKRLIYLAVPFMLSGCFGCTYVKPGYVAVKVDLYGRQRGVQDYPVVTGRVLYNPWTTQLYDFPIFLQYRSWVLSPNEGKPEDESISCTSLDKILVNLDVSIAYKFIADKVPVAFVTFRSDPDTIADTYIRSRVRDAFQQACAQQNAMSILGGGVGDLDSAVKKILSPEMEAKGINLDYVSVINKPRLPQNIQNAIDQTIESQQQAAREMNQVAVKKALADQDVAVAIGKANAVKAQADGNAYQILVEAKSQAQANQIIAASLTQELVQLKAIEKWQGDVPTWQTGSGNAIPFINIQPPSSK